MRDPLNRLLSAYLDKFVKSPRRGMHGNYGFRFFGSALSFEQFAQRVASNNTYRDLPDGLHLGTNPHWKPQRYICSLEKFAHVYNFIGRFENVREHAESLLRALGLWDSFGATGWAPKLAAGLDNETRRDSLFARSSPHKTESSARYAELYAPPGLEDLLRNAYAMDYELLGALGADPTKPPVSGFGWASARRHVDRRRLCDLDPSGFGAYCETTGL